MTKSLIPSCLNLSTETLTHWQRLLEIVATMLNVPAVFIAKMEFSQLEVLAANHTMENPFQVGNRFSWTEEGFFGQTIANRNPLRVANALNDPRWENSKDSIAGMTAYFGLPLQWPDGTVFGIICVLDSRENAFGKEYKFLDELRTGLERDLKLETLSLSGSKEDDKSDKKYLESVDEVATIVLRWDINGNVTFFNKFAQKFFGFSEEEIIGKNVVGTIVPETEFTGRDLAALMEQICRDPSKFEYNENENVKRNGERVWIAWKNRPIFKKSGELFEIHSTGIDISARKRAEEALRESEALWRSLTESTPDHIMTLDKDLNIQFVNYASPGLSEQTLIGTPLYKYTEEQKQAEVKSALEKVLKTGEPCTYETQYQTAEGVTLYYESLVAPRILSNEVVGLTVNARDITQHKLTEEALRSSEQRLRVLISQADIVLWSVDTQLKFTQSLGAGLQRIGLKENQVVGEGLDLYQFYHTDSRDYPTIRFHLLALKGSAVSYEDEWRGRFFQSHVTPQRDSDGNIVGCIGVAVDITERKHAENALRRSEVLELLAKGGALNDILTALVISAEKRDSNAFCAISLLDDESKHLNYVVTPNLPDFFTKAIDKTELGIGPGSCSTVAQTGERIIVEDILNCPEWSCLKEVAEKAGLRACCCEPIKSSKGVVLGTFPVYYKKPYMPNKSDLEFIQDSARIAGIAIERKQAESALRESEQRYRSLVELSPDGVAVHDLEGKLVFANTVARKIVGAPDDMNVLGESIGRFIHPDHFNEAAALIEKMVKEQKSSETVHQKFITMSGNVVDVEVSGAPLIYGGKPAIQIIIRDITDRKKAEEKIRASEKELAAILDSIQDIYYRTDVAGHLLRLSPSVSHVLGYRPEELLGEKIADYWVNPQDREQFIEALNSQGGVVENYETMAKHKDGTHIWVSASSHYYLDDQGHIAGVEGTIRDVSNRKQAEEQARQHQTELAYIARLSTMGELATGIAHELNQPLTAIANYAAASCKMVAADSGHLEKLVSALQAIQVQADRASEIIRRLRKFVKKQNPQKADVDINTLIKDVFNFMETEIKSHRVQVQFDLSDDLPSVRADAIQIEQVLVNLIRNSLDSMSHIDAHFRKLSFRSHLDAPGYVQVDVIDTGEGIDAYALSEIFAPHVTTKDVKGMGMGLSISRSIIDLHKGRLWAESEKGKGASFSFTLPTKVKET